VDIQVLLPSWQRSLKAARRSPRTIQSYTEAAEQLSDFLVGNGMSSAIADIHPEHVEAFIVDLAQRFRPATVGVRFRSLQQLFRWALEEGEITANPMARMRSPSVPESPPAVLSDPELRGFSVAVRGRISSPGATQPSCGRSSTRARGGRRSQGFAWRTWTSTT
jgi:site-specific recombinase XerD